MMDIITIISISSINSSSGSSSNSGITSSSSSTSNTELSVSLVFGAHRALLTAVCALRFSDFPVIPCKCRRRSLNLWTAGFLVNVRTLQLLHCSYTADVTKLDAFWSKSKN